MIKRYFNGVIKQVHEQVGVAGKNIVMILCGNDFPADAEWSIKRYSADEEDSVFFAYRQYNQGSIAETYDPFLNIIVDCFKKYGDGNFERFLTEAGIYKLQIEPLLSYYENGFCKRSQPVLLSEAEYERELFIKGIVSLLVECSKIKPVIIALNRFQLADKGTMSVVKYLVENPLPNIGIIIGVSESGQCPLFLKETLGCIQKKLVDRNCVFNMGYTGVINRNKDGAVTLTRKEVDDIYRRINNMTELLDFESADYHLDKLYKRTKALGYVLPDDLLCQFGLLYAKNSVMVSDFSMALEILNKLSRIDSNFLKFGISYLKAVCYMYLDKLDDAMELAEDTCQRSLDLDDEELLFISQLLKIRIKMAGWNNLFFMIKDIDIPDETIEGLKKYKFYNYLAYVYVYAYDNDPKLVKKAYDERTELTNFKKGIAIAEWIGNDQLVYHAYQKNVMLASTNGMNNIALFYAVHTYLFLGKNKSVLLGRTLSSIGYNLSAIGYYSKAEKFYDEATAVLYSIKEGSEIAEVKYNLALNYFAQNRFEEAEKAFTFAINTVENLHMNSLRVCNLSKLYALLALSNLMQGQIFSGDRYLRNCKYFLKYVLDKSDDGENIESLHDYALCDDDMFLYFFAMGLYYYFIGDYDTSYGNFEVAQVYFDNSEGNQFYCKELFRTKKIEVLEKVGKSDLVQVEKDNIKKYKQDLKKYKADAVDDIIGIIELEQEQGKISDAQLEFLISKMGMEYSYHWEKKNLEYFSDWQKFMDRPNVDREVLISDAMQSFLNHFGNDKAVFVRFDGEKPLQLFNNTKIILTDEMFMKIHDVMARYPEGFVVSRIHDSFSEYLDIISFFGRDEVCSIAAVPCYEAGRIQSVFITYIKMKANWHNSVNRYMLTDSDLDIYRMLIIELNNYLNREEANRKIVEMNKKLSAAATTDVLTGLYNRAGMYHEVSKLEKKLEQNNNDGVSLLFIDLDNFKLYNDTFGHDIGDVVLQKMAEIYKEAAGEDGIVCRYGGDEFIIILKTSSKEKIKKVVEEIYDKIDKAEGFKQAITEKTGKEFVLSKENQVGCSIGIALTADIMENSIESLIKEADDLLYSVKTKTKGTYRFI